MINANYPLQHQRQKALSTPDKPVLVAGESGTSEIVLSTVPAAWDGFEVRALLTTPTRILVDAFAVGSGFLLTNTMLDAQGYLYIEFVAYRGGTEIDRSLPASLYVNAARSILGDIDPAPLPDLVAEMVAAKGGCDGAAEAAVLATERIEITDAEIKAAEVIRVTAEGARAEQAASDHTTAQGDHTQAGTDHTTAVGDHNTAATDHTTAQSDHTTAANDHTVAVADHTAVAPTIAEVQNARNGFANLDARLDDSDAKKISTDALYSFVINGNKEVSISAVDITTGVFTAIAHGFANGTPVIPVLNQPNRKDYPAKYIVGGLPIGRYYVKVIDENTFSLSLTVGGANVPLVSNSTMDITKWHFEALLDRIAVTGLPELKKCRIIVRGVVPRLDSILPYSTAHADYFTQTYFASGQTSINNYPSLYAGGSVDVFVSVFIDCSNGLRIEATGHRVSMNTATANIAQQVYAYRFDPYIVINTFNKIGIFDSYLTNGTKIEVYKS